MYYRIDGKPVKHKNSKVTVKASILENKGISYGICKHYTVAESNKDNVVDLHPKDVEIGCFRCVGIPVPYNKVMSSLCIGTIIVAMRTEVNNLHDIRISSFTNSDAFSRILRLSFYLNLTSLGLIDPLSIPNYGIDYNVHQNSFNKGNKTTSIKLLVDVILGGEDGNKQSSYVGKIVPEVDKETKDEGLKYQLSTVLRAFRMVDSCCRFIYLSENILRSNEYQPVLTPSSGYLKPTKAMVHLSRLLLKETRSISVGKAKEPDSTVINYIENLERALEANQVKIDTLITIDDGLGKSESNSTVNPNVTSIEDIYSYNTTQLLKHYSERRIAKYQAERKDVQVNTLIKLIKDKIPGPLNDKCFIDVGCGRGNFLVSAVKALGGYGIGIDTNEGSLLSAIELSRMEGLDDSLTFIFGNIIEPESLVRIIDRVRKFDQVIFCGLHACGELSDVIFVFSELLRECYSVRILNRKSNVV